jgi:hypothetical protein
MFRRCRNAIFREPSADNTQMGSTHYLHLFGTYDVAYAQFRQDHLGYLKMALLQHNCRVQPYVVYGFGMLVHWSRYWLGHRRTFSMVSFTFYITNLWAG